LPYSGIVALSGSKSILQRYMFVASLQPAVFNMAPGSVCDDVLEMAQALKDIGIDVSVTENEISIDSAKCELFADSQVRFKASATALRFWLARSLISKGKTTILISEELYRRPLEPFLNSLKQLGCIIDVYKTLDKEFPHKIEISSPKTLPAEIELDANISSQFISGLMLIAPLSLNCLKLNFMQEAVSYHYLELTASVLENLKMNAQVEPRRVVVTGNYPDLIIKSLIQIESELAGGAFFLALGAFSKQGIGIQTTPPPGLQPDWEILSIIQQMGAELVRNGTTAEIKSGELHGITLDMEHYPDLVPLIAVVALFAVNPSVLNNISRLHYKESDRIKGILNAFDLIGAQYNIDGSNLQIYPLQNNVKEVTLDTQNDHRLVLAFTLLQLHFPLLKLSETDSVKKSCPEFFQLLENLKLKS